MGIISCSDVRPAIEDMICNQRSLAGGAERPFLLLEGDALAVLRLFPAGSIDCVITSPPYWNQREYASAEAIGGRGRVRRIPPRCWRFLRK